MKAYVILISRHDGKPFYEQDNFCFFESADSDADESDNSVQISFNKEHVERQLATYLPNKTWKYDIAEVEVCLK